MKSIIALILLSGSLGYSADTNVMRRVVLDSADTNIVTKVSESYGVDGRVTLRTEEMFRGAERILITISRPNKDGRLVVTTRAYLMNGHVVASEQRMDPEDKLESLMIRGPSADAFEVFIRETDGSVTPVSGTALEAYKKWGAITEAALRGTLSVDEFNRQFGEVRKVIDSERKKAEQRK
jgi:hypothetical protein